MTFGELMAKGGPTMWPLLILSILALSTILERLWFWFNLFSKERQIVNRVLEAAHRDWVVAGEIAKRAYRQPVGRFLYAPLKLNNPGPDVFSLALEAAAEEELAQMRKGDKLLEGVIALSPLLGLLGTVLGLIYSLGSIRLGDIGTASTSGVTTGIGEALISTATGMIVAIISLAFYRSFQGFIFHQMKLFRRAGNELELLYRQFYQQGFPLPSQGENFYGENREIFDSQKNSSNGNDQHNNDQHNENILPSWLESNLGGNSEVNSKVNSESDVRDNSEINSESNKDNIPQPKDEELPAQIDTADKNITPVDNSENISGNINENITALPGENDHNDHNVAK